MIDQSEVLADQLNSSTLIERRRWGVGPRLGDTNCQLVAWCTQGGHVKDEVAVVLSLPVLQPIFNQRLQGSRGEWKVLCVLRDSPLHFNPFTAHLLEADKVAAQGYFLLEGDERFGL